MTTIAITPNDPKSKITKMCSEIRQFRIRSFRCLPSKDHHLQENIGIYRNEVIGKSINLHLASSKTGPQSIRNAMPLLRIFEPPIVEILYG